MILITTVGKVGTAAASYLAGLRQPVRVLVRDPARAELLPQDAVDVVVGDLDDRESLARAMDGVRSVVLVSPAIPAQELAAVEAASLSGVQHVVKITSKASADSPIARRRDQAAIEEGLAASGLGWTLLRNNAYMQNLLMLAPAIAATGSFGSATGDGKIGMVDARDVGEVAAEIARDPAGHSRQTYWPTGPQSLTYGEAADVLSAELGRPVRHDKLSFEEQMDVMLSAGLPEPVARANAQAIALFADGDSDWVTSDVGDVLGRPPRSFAQFAHDFHGAFEPAGA